MLASSILIPSQRRQLLLQLWCNWTCIMSILVTRYGHLLSLKTDACHSQADTHLILILLRWLLLLRYPLWARASSSRTTYGCLLAWITPWWWLVKSRLDKAKALWHWPSPFALRPLLHALRQPRLRKASALTTITILFNIKFFSLQIILKLIQWVKFIIDICFQSLIRLSKRYSASLYSLICLLLCYGVFNLCGSRRLDHTVSELCCLLIRR